MEILGQSALDPPLKAVWASAAEPVWEFKLPGFKPLSLFTHPTVSILSEFNKSVHYGNLIWLNGNNGKIKPKLSHPYQSIWLLKQKLMSFIYLCPSVCFLLPMQKFNYNALSILMTFLEAYIGEISRNIGVPQWRAILIICAFSSSKWGSLRVRR